MRNAIQEEQFVTTGFLHTRTVSGLDDESAIRKTAAHVTVGHGPHNYGAALPLPYHRHVSTAIIAIEGDMV